MNNLKLTNIDPSMFPNKIEDETCWQIVFLNKNNLNNIPCVMGDVYFDHDTAINTATKLNAKSHENIYWVISRSLSFTKFEHDGLKMSQDIEDKGKIKMNKKMTKKELIKELKEEFDKYYKSVQRWMKKCEDNGMTYYFDKEKYVKASCGDIIHDLINKVNINNWLTKTR